MDKGGSVGLNNNIHI